jgi:hypothetical protein
VHFVELLVQQELDQIIPAGHKFVTIMHLYPSQNEPDGQKYTGAWQQLQLLLKEVPELQEVPTQAVPFQLVPLLQVGLLKQAFPCKNCPYGH